MVEGNHFSLTLTTADCRVSSLTGCVLLVGEELLTVNCFREFLLTGLGDIKLELALNHVEKVRALTVNRVESLLSIDTFDFTVADQL